MTAPVLMVLGTASSVGKSVLTTALCRIFRQDGVRVAPFKAQNMSNKADVTADGLEIGRAQSEQAAAAGLAPTVQMNPVLLKPQGDRTSQIVLDGRPAGTLHAGSFAARRELWPAVERALASLRNDYDLVVAEGAGSPAETNLREGDIVNMSVALHTDATVLLVGDIDRGGVFAHLVGTMELLAPEERALVRGFVINRFRGDPSLLTPAIDDLERRTGIPVLGVIPWLDDLRIADEDAVVLERASPAAGETGGTETDVDIAVVRLPRIANFDDFDPFVDEPSVRLRYVSRPQDLGRPQLVILPGTKATVADLEALRGAGLDEAVRRAHADGASVLGICGGFQMLGERIHDPGGVETAPGNVVEGLALLPLTTTFAAEKTTVRSSGHVEGSGGAWQAAAGAAVEGYEIHMGTTEGAARPLLTLNGHADGAISGDGRVAGTYLHGLFHNDALRHALLSGLGRGETTLRAFDREREFDRLAQHARAPRR
ncbi:MAG: cobyric acid synthase [Dehalococcoidia bacterium]|jgi:adenosylcobyric acid synthase|nr:cobyric acid synthase [Dehalococcoidia bacterium]